MKQKKPKTPLEAFSQACEAMKYRILKEGEVIVDDDEEKDLYSKSWQRVPPEFVGLRFNDSWDTSIRRTSIRRPIKAKKPKAPLEAFKMATRDLAKENKKRTKSKWKVTLITKRKPKKHPKPPLSSFGHPCVNAYKAYHGKADCTHVGYENRNDQASWCPNCGAISVGGGAWRLPKSARHPYYK